MLKIFAIPYVLVEAILIILFISECGFLIFLSEVIISAIIGVFCLFRHGLGKIMQNSFLTTFEMVRTFGISIGGLFLIFPGILSDCIGIVILVVWLFSAKKQNSTLNSNTKFSTNDENIIDVEIIQESRK